MSSRPVVDITRKTGFCASHRYHNEAWSAEKNREVFGACNNPYGHGHDYELEVTIRGPVEAGTGMVLNLTDIDATLRELVVDVLDHRYLNAEVDGFDRVIPTTENIALWIWERLEPAFADGPGRLHRLRLRESDDLWVDCFAEGSGDEGAGPRESRS